MRARLEAALLEIDAFTRQFFPAAPIVVGALAEGADRYGAAVALKAGWAVEVILPFSKRRYEQAFTSKKSRAEFSALLALARRTEVLEGEMLEWLVGPHEPYAALGRRLVRVADITVAVWDGAAAAGPGGTADVIGLSLADGAPVVWLGVAPDAPTRLLLPLKTAARKREIGKTLQKALAARFEIAPPPAALSVRALP